MEVENFFAMEMHQRECVLTSDEKKVGNSGLCWRLEIWVTCVPGGWIYEYWKNEKVYNLVDTGELLSSELKLLSTKFVPHPPQEPNPFAGWYTDMNG